MYDESDDDMSNQKYASLLPIQQYCTAISDKVTCPEVTPIYGACEKRWNELSGVCNDTNGGSFDVAIKDTCKLSCRNSFCKWLMTFDSFVLKSYLKFLFKIIYVLSILVYHFNTLC